MDFSQGPALGAVVPHNAIPSKDTKTCLSYHEDGVHLFAATPGDSKLYLINSQTGKMADPQPHPLKCERDGISLLSSTHHDYCVLAAGPTQNTINYWSLYDNKILRKFRGHAGYIHDMSLCPSEDLFLTASSDKTVRLWNIQQAGCVGKMDLPLAQTQGNPYVAFDSTGMVFAVMAEMTNNSSSVTAGGYYVHLYDARNFSGGAFSEMQVTNQSLLEAIVTHRVAATPPPQPPTLESISFNASGNRILVQSPGHGIAYVLDGYEGTVQRVFVSSKGSATCSCFTPDDQSLLLGSDAGMVECFNLQSGQMVRQLDGGHDGGPVGALACNPKYTQIASSGADTCLWIW